MFVTVVATVCHLLPIAADATDFAVKPIEACEKVIVGDSDSVPGLDFMGCLMAGQAPLAEWFEANYGEGYRLDRYSCIQGHYTLPREARAGATSQPRINAEWTAPSHTAKSPS